MFLRSNKPKKSVDHSILRKNNKRKPSSGGAFNGASETLDLSAKNNFSSLISGSTQDKFSSRAYYEANKKLIVNALASDSGLAKSMAIVNSVGWGIEGGYG